MLVHLRVEISQNNVARFERVASLHRDLDQRQRLDYHLVEQSLATLYLILHHRLFVRYPKLPRVNLLPEHLTFLELRELLQAKDVSDVLVQHLRWRYHRYRLLQSVIDFRCVCHHLNVLRGVNVEYAEVKLRRLHQIH